MNKLLKILLILSSLILNFNLKSAEVSAYVAGPNKLGLTIEGVSDIKSKHIQINFDGLKGSDQVKITKTVKIGNKLFALGTLLIEHEGKLGKYYDKLLLVIELNADSSVEKLIKLQLYYEVLPFALIIQEDGKILVVGKIKNENRRIFLARFLNDGTVDVTFGHGRGFLDHAIPFDVERMNLDIQNDKIWIAGFTKGKHFVMRFNLDGSFDITYGKEGYIIAEE